MPGSGLLGQLPVRLRRLMERMMKGRNRTPSACPRIGALASLAIVISACTDKTVVAKVDGTKLRQADIAAYRGARGKDAKETLGALVDRTLLAEAGRKAGLADDPVLQARI